MTATLMVPMGSDGADRPGMDAGDGEVTIVSEQTEPASSTLNRREQVGSQAVQLADADRRSTRCLNRQT
ncbi:MAG: hypothetical protein J0H65_09805 [Rhizobiales bacterium]|nr:hypothetical protein [Hyphomicrobiales bacterium]